jgi:DNA-binding transcriptional ArsR family regulator
MATDRLSATFAALSDPTRRAILARLALGETSVTELAQPFEMSLPAVTKHLKVLEKAGLIIRGREAQWRPCRLEAKPLQEAVGWIEQYRKFWEERLDRLEDYLRELQAQENALPLAGMTPGGAGQVVAAGEESSAEAQKDSTKAKEKARGRPAK